MNAQDFTYWLQGFFEMTPKNELSEEQVKMIREHLALVFNKVTPNQIDFTKYQPSTDPMYNPNQIICSTDKLC